MAHGMKLKVYIAGKYTGRTHSPESYGEIDHHIWLAREAAKKVWELGAACFCPHLNSAHFEVDCKATAQDYYDGDLAFLECCDAILMLENWKESSGSKIEREKAIEWNMPIFYSLDELAVWLKAQ